MAARIFAEVLVSPCTDIEAIKPNNVTQLIIHIVIFKYVLFCLAFHRCMVGHSCLCRPGHEPEQLSAKVVCLPVVILRRRCAQTCLASQPSVCVPRLGSTTIWWRSSKCRQRKTFGRFQPFLIAISHEGTQYIIEVQCHDCIVRLFHHVNSTEPHSLMLFLQEHALRTTRHLTTKLVLKL